MNYYIISPKVDGSKDYLPEMIKDKVVLMGWNGSPEEKNGKYEMFKNMSIGDIVIVAQGANYQKKTYFIGKVSSNIDESEWPIRRSVSDMILMDDNDVLPFGSDCKWGDSKNPGGAIYCLDPQYTGDQNVINKIKQLYMKEFLLANRNIVLHGAPGTGKTYMAKEIANEMGATKENGRFDFVQFHPSYDYTDFVEGLRPVKNDDAKEIGFERKDGVFKTFCKKALADKDHNFVFVIDEINRGDMSKIFGELFFSIDPGYRGVEGNVSTQYQNLVEEKDVFYKGFFVPENVYIIGTMNDIDRSVESMDFAMRRRFAFKEVKVTDTQDAILGDMTNKEELVKRMDNLNNAIVSKEVGLSVDYQIGGAYFVKCKDKDYDALWNNHLACLLKEYLRGMSDADGKFNKLKDAYDLKVIYNENNG